MATDPVQQIEEQRYETPFVEDLPAVLVRLAALPPSVDPPYLTLSVDCRPEGMRPNRRPGLDYVEQNAEEFLAGFQPHTPAHDSLSGDLQRIRQYLGAELDPAVQGVVFVACSGAGVFEVLPLGVPMPNAFVTAPTPALRTLAQMSEDEPVYAALLADQREATLSLIDQAARRQSVAVESTGFPRKQMQGGWSQRRYQQRADERIEAFARTVADETQRAMDEAGVETLVLAGDEQIATTLTDAFHQTVKERIAGSVRLDVRASEREVIEATLPLVEQAERARETAAVVAVREGAGPGGKAVTGAVDTLTALQTGQAMTLVMNDDFTAPGWADYTFPVYGAGEVPGEHPAGGDVAKIVPIALEEEAVRLALQAGAEIEIVRTAVPVGADELAATPEAGETIPRSEAARELDRLGGIGVTLRYVLDADQSTADL